ncbi:hypothetical protein EU508_00205 [Pseudoalteromonas fuliginea]|uniref:Uncharacterized protein n=1 Tax=Pseudoalteromonas fuliginea TaxID=1872678 RepID=A0AB73BMD1_9GAMM|nr:hypothetical protein [Pseudoalteromonas fuliginea]KAA1166132.1 hypothetical protein EU508_00205 [Pseudoalteromonas fuliginea]
MKSILTLFLIIASTTAYSSVWTEGVAEKISTASTLNCGEYPNIKSLQAKFECESALLEISNALYKGWLNTNKIERKESLFCFWSKGNPKSESFDEIFANPIVRLNIAALIGQLKKVSSLTINIKEQREYARAYIFSSNNLVLVDSITAIGWVGERKDLHILLEIIQEEKEGIAENAVLSVINLLSNDYQSILSKLSKSLKRESLQKFIEERL